MSFDTTPKTDSSKFMTAVEAAALIGVSRYLFGRMCQAAGIKQVQGTRLYRRAEIEELANGGAE